MIGLKISGRTAEITPNTSISMKLVNPIFNENNLSPGSYSLPFDLPGGEVSAENAAIFKNPDVIENNEGFVRQDAQIFFDGVPYKKGKIKAKAVSPSRLSAHFSFGLSTISDEIKTKKLRDLLDEEIVIDDSAVTKKIFIKPNPQFLDPDTLAVKPFPIIVNGKTFTEDTLELLRDAINANTDEPRAFAIIRSTGVSSGGLAAPYLELQSLDTVDPLTDLSVDIDTNIAYDGVENQVKYFVHGEMADINFNGYYDPFWTFLSGYFTGDYPTDKIRFPAVFNLNLLHNGIQPDAATVTLIRNEVSGFHVINRNSLHPFVRVKWVLDQIASYFGLQFEGDFYTSADTDEMLIWNPNSLTVEKPYIGKTQFVFWKRSFNIKDLVPDISVVDFLKDLQNRYNLAVYYNDRTGKVVLAMRETIAKDLLYSDITSRCSPIQESEDLAITGVKLTAKREDKDLFAEDDFFDIGDPEEEYKTNLSAISQFTTRSTLGGDVQGPEVYQPQETSFNFRVFYYKGLFNNGTVSYPKAHIHAINYTDRYDDPNGTGILETTVYDYFWKRWISYVLRRKIVNVEIDFPIGDLLAFDWELKRRFDRNNYLIKSLEFALTPTQLTVCKAELYTMR